MNISENEQTIRGLERTLFSLHPNAEAIYNAIKVLSINTPEKPVKNNFIAPYTIVYPSKDGVSQKIMFALLHIGRFAPVSAIKKKIMEYEPDFNYMLNTALTKLQEENKIVSYSPSGSRKDVFYGFPKWGDKSGKPQVEYMNYKIDYSDL